MIFNLEVGDHFVESLEKLQDAVDALDKAGDDTHAQCLCDVVNYANDVVAEYVIGKIASRP